MPNDARVGLVMGVTLVILVAVLFARKEGAQGRPAGNIAGATVATSKLPPNATPPVVSRPVTAPGPRTHTVGEGESLMYLSQLYYGDRNHISELFAANRDRIRAPDRVPEGTVLIIPAR